MNSDRLELALKKQRLQIASERLRSGFAQHAVGLMPAFTTVDHLAAAARWLRRHPQLVVAAGVALVVVRPRRAWRWGRRAFVGWQAWRKVRGFLQRHRLNLT